MKIGLGYNPSRVNSARQHIPNAITVARLILSVILFVLLVFVRRSPESISPLLMTAFVLYLVASISDFVDGHLARKWKVTSGFGRVVDPFVDKILVLGCFVLFCGVNFLDTSATPIANHTGVVPWMVVVLIARELLVTVLRSMIESTGKPFPSDWSGKVKMVVQCLAIGWIIGHLAIEPWLRWLGLAGFNLLLRDVLIWTTLAVTVLSALTYCQRSIQLSRGSAG